MLSFSFPDTWSQGLCFICCLFISTRQLASRTAEQLLQSACHQIQNHLNNSQSYTTVIIIKFSTIKLGCPSLSQKKKNQSTFNFHMFCKYRHSSWLQNMHFLPFTSHFPLTKYCEKIFWFFHRVKLATEKSFTIDRVNLLAKLSLNTSHFTLSSHSLSQS